MYTNKGRQPILTDTFSDNAVALILASSAPDADALKGRIREALLSEGLPSWNGIDADIFTYKGRTLVLARPAPPLLSRPTLSHARLKRAK